MEPMSRAFETTHSENVTLRKQFTEADELPRSHNIRKRGKRVALRGRFDYSTQGVVKLVEEAKAETAEKDSRKRPQKRKLKKAIEEKDGGVLTKISNHSYSD